MADDGGGGEVVSSKEFRRLSQICMMQQEHKIAACFGASQLRRKRECAEATVEVMRGSRVLEAGGLHGATPSATLDIKISAKDYVQGLAPTTQRYKVDPPRF